MECINDEVLVNQVIHKLIPEANEVNRSIGIGCVSCSRKYPYPCHKSFLV